MEDLFRIRTDKDKLLDFIRKKHWVKTSEVIRFGVENYSNRSERNARQLAKEGKIRRMSNVEKRFSFGKIKESVWVYNGQ